MVYYNYRYLNPLDGRWINRDFINEQGGNNLYSFLYNKDVYKRQIFGLGTPEIIAILVIVFPALFLVIFLVVWRFHRFARCV